VHVDHLHLASFKVAELDSAVVVADDDDDDDDKVGSCDEALEALAFLLVWLDVGLDPSFLTTDFNPPPPPSSRPPPKPPSSPT
jgi:hypothetical protein